jgi:hypothetical protein
MSDNNHTPVSLAAGSHDYDALKSGLGKASRGAAKSYPSAVEKAIADARGDAATATIDPRSIDGYKFVEVENKDLGVTEKVQVYDPGLAEDATSDANAAPSEADLMTTQAERTADAAAAADGTSKE